MEGGDFGRFYTATGGGDYTQTSIYFAVKWVIDCDQRLVQEQLKTLFLALEENWWKVQKALNTGQDSTAELGIEVVDVRVKQINLPDEVSSSIYQRMRAERDAVARVDIARRVKKKLRLFKQM